MEIVDATIIGEITKERPYAFFKPDGKQITAGKWFSSDKDAIEWFKRGWPDKYKNGAEMRVYNV